MKPGTKKWFARGKKNKSKDTNLVIKLSKRIKYSKQDRMLRKFNYSEALRIALKSNNGIQILSLIEELWRRDGIEKAITNCAPFFLASLLKWIIKFIDNSKINIIILYTLSKVVKSHKNNFGKYHIVDVQWNKLKIKLKQEIQYQKSLTKLQGILCMLYTQNT